MAGAFRPVSRALRLPGGSRLHLGSLNASVRSCGTASSAVPVAERALRGDAAGDHIRPWRDRRISEGTRQSDKGVHRNRSREHRTATTEVQRLGRQRRWQEALVVFGTVPEPDVVLHTATLDALSRSLQLNHARRLFAEMPVKTIAPYNVMIYLLGKLRLEHEAVEFMEDMKRESIQPNETTYCSLISAHGVMQDSEGAIRVLDEMLSAGLSHSGPAYGAAMTACGRAGDVARAKDLRVRMEKHRVELDSGHYSSLIAAHARAGDGTGARAALEEMRRSGLRPSVVTYTSLLAGLSGPGALVKVEETFEEMRKDGIEPDTLAYNALLGAAVASRAPDRFWEILAEMEARGVPPNEITEQRIAGCKALEQQPAESPLPPGWHETCDPASGHFYYWAEADPAGTTTWVRPT
mmetsp:Transcript_34926/g.104519  ORF Transcript_34926/g.104519 Transcript_34926/m.104519 type:complete len:409 (+) Transcript_34926:35-1261(+)